MSNKNLKKSENVEKILERLKKAYGLQTDQDVASLLGYKSTGTISNWKERGKVNWNRIESYCENVRKDYLTTGERPMFKNPSMEEKVTEYESLRSDSGPSDTERDLLIEFLRDQAESLSEGLRRLSELERKEKKDD